jgi:hypothetical protein
VPACACGFVGLRKCKELVAIIGGEMKNAVAAVANQCPPPKNKFSPDGYTSWEKSNRRKTATIKEK